MRTITTAQSAVLALATPAEHVRVQVKDSGGTFRSLDTYPGVNLIDSVSWREDVDAPHATADIVLKREVEKLSLSPLLAASALNHAFDPTTGAAALLALGREIKIDVAVVAMDSEPVVGDWQMAFHGYIDTIDPAARDTVIVGCRDLGAKVMDAFIETERVYAYGSGGVGISMRVWEPGTAYALNEYILPASRGTNDPGVAKFYKCTTAGTSGSTEPVWPGSSTIADGGAVHTYQGATSSAGLAVETVMQQILTDNVTSAPTLDVPSSPSWAISEFLQQRQGALDAIRALALQIGWDIRYVWKSASSDFVLRLYEPDRAKVAVDQTFGPDDYEDFKRLALDISGIRNAVRVIYSDAADTWPDGTPKRKSITVTDATSITAYGRRFMEIAEDSASQIDTSTEATAMANACLSDLKEPTADADVLLAQGFPWVELGDLYTFSADGRRFDSDQTLAVYGWSHDASGGRIKTTLRVRGTPAGGFDRWHAVSVRPDGRGMHGTVPFQASATVSATVTPTVGGAKVQLGVSPDKRAHVEEYEHHISSSSSFTPSSSTLKEISKARTVVIPELVPGGTYYHKAVPRTRNAERIIRGQPTVEQTFTAGRAQAGHLNADVNWGRLPLNGSFETDTTGVFADHWTESNGAASIVRTVGTGGVSGDAYATFSAVASQVSIISDTFSLVAGRKYLLTAWTKNTTGVASKNWMVELLWLLSDKTQNDAGDHGGFFVLSTTNNGVWVKYSAVVTVGTSAKYGQIQVRKETATDALAFSIDDIRLELLGSVNTGLYSVAGAYTADEDECVSIDASGGACAVTLPSAATVGSGRRYSIKKIDSSGNAVTVTPAGSETIDGAANKALSSQWDSVTIVSDGTNWLIFA